MKFLIAVLAFSLYIGHANEIEGGSRRELFGPVSGPIICACIGGVVSGLVGAGAGAACTSREKKTVVRVEIHNADGTVKVITKEEGGQRRNLGWMTNGEESADKKYLFGKADSAGCPATDTPALLKYDKDANDWRLPCEDDPKKVEVYDNADKLKAKQPNAALTQGVQEDLTPSGNQVCELPGKTQAKGGDAKKTQAKGADAAKVQADTAKKGTDAAKTQQQPAPQQKKKEKTELKAKHAHTKTVDSEVAGSTFTNLPTTNVVVLIAFLSAIGGSIVYYQRRKHDSVNVDYHQIEEI